MMPSIAYGMSQLHGCGLIHKDFKASNIFVLPDSWIIEEDELDPCVQLHG
jgi:serine/threonine protein kinase